MYKNGVEEALDAQNLLLFSLSFICMYAKLMTIAVLVVSAVLDCQTKLVPHCLIRFNQIEPAVLPHTCDLVQGNNFVCKCSAASLPFT